MSCILSIDPGTNMSAYVVGDGYTPIAFAKIDNNELLALIPTLIEKYAIEESAIEMIASYGKGVGREVFETCVWIGRFHEAILRCSAKVAHIYRKDVKMDLCGKTKVKDADIRKALIARFAKHDFINGKGNKENPDIFRGVHSDIWAAISVLTCYIDKRGDTD